MKAYLIIPSHDLSFIRAFASYDGAQKALQDIADTQRGWLPATMADRVIVKPDSIQCGQNVWLLVELEIEQ